MKSTRLTCFTAMALLIALAVPGSLAAQTRPLPYCRIQTEDLYLGQNCQWGYWEFHIDEYNASATGGAQPVPARTISLQPTHYQAEYFGFIITGIAGGGKTGWNVGKNQTQKSEFIIWINSLPEYGKIPAGFLNGIQTNSVVTTGTGSCAARYFAYDGQNNSIPGGNALLYQNSMGKVTQQPYTQTFPSGVILPIVMHLVVSCVGGSNGTATAGQFFFSAS